MCKGWGSLWNRGTGWRNSSPVTELLEPCKTAAVATTTTKLNARTETRPRHLWFMTPKPPLHQESDLSSFPAPLPPKPGRFKAPLEGVCAEKPRLSEVTVLVSEESERWHPTLMLESKRACMEFPQMSSLPREQQ